MHGLRSVGFVRTIALRSMEWNHLCVSTTGKIVTTAISNHPVFVRGKRATICELPIPETLGIRRIRTDPSTTNRYFIATREKGICLYDETGVCLSQENLSDRRFPKFRDLIPTTDGSMLFVLEASQLYRVDVCTRRTTPLCGYDEKASRDGIGLNGVIHGGYAMCFDRSSSESIIFVLSVKAGIRRFEIDNGNGWFVVSVSIDFSCESFVFGGRVCR